MNHDIFAKDWEEGFQSCVMRKQLALLNRLDEDGKVLTPEELLYRVWKLNIVTFFSTLNQCLPCQAIMQPPWMNDSRKCMCPLCLSFPGSAVSKHEPWSGTRSDGYQVQVSRLCWPQVSFQSRIHRLEDISLFINVILRCSYYPSEQVLHLWLEVLCSSMAAVEKWYHPWSFLRSPGWVQIKCELR